MITLKRNLLTVFNGRYGRLEAGLVALALTVLIFPDVIFRQASLRVTDQIAGTEQNTPLRPFYPVGEPDRWWGGYNDNGGAAFQSEPMIEFMRYSIKNGESPYWNPYSAAGSLGPESLVDQKFSAFTLINAVLGGGTTVYNATLLCLYFCSVYFIYRIARDSLRLSVLSGIGMALFFVLNGFSVANFGSNITQSYLYVPMCLYAVLTFFEKTGMFRFVAIVISFAVFFSCTFIPTAITSLMAIFVIAVGWILAKVSRRGLSAVSAMALIVCFSAGVVVSIFLDAVIYFPILENITGSGMLESYSSRVFYPLVFPQAIASFFSPSHLYESYNAMEDQARFWHVNSVSMSITGNTVFHFGIIAIALAGCAWSWKKNIYGRLINVCFLSIAFGIFRLFEVRLLGAFISFIPVVGKIGCQYWWPVIIFPVMILLGFGIHNLQGQNARIMPALLLLVVGAAVTFYVYKLYGLHGPRMEFKVDSIRLLSLLAAIVAVFLIALRFYENVTVRGIVVCGLVAGMFLELMVDSKMIRFQRSDVVSAPPEAIAYVASDSGLYRTLNFGRDDLYPELESAFQIQEISALNQGTSPAYIEYFNSAVNLDAAQRFGYSLQFPLGTFPTLMSIQDKPSSNRFNWPALDLLGLKYILLPASFMAYKGELLHAKMHLVLATPKTLVFENPNVLPRAFAVDFPRSEVRSAIALPAEFRKRVYPQKIASYHNAEVVIKGNASAEMLVVISDNWHRGWRATLNDKEVPIIKVNGTFRGIAVSRGDYVIKMNYRPRTLPLAIAISLGVFLVMIIMLVVRNTLDASIHRRWPIWAI